jgi:TniQ
MMYFPRPYPDELSGSLIVRARRHLGLTRYQMMTLISGRRDTHLPFMFSGLLPRIAELARLDEEELLVAHTPFCHLTAFMSRMATVRLRDQLIRKSDRDDRCYVRLNRMATEGDVYRRFCRVCAESEHSVFGEPYWHRTHNLPGVDVCLTHGCALQRVPVTLIHGGFGLYEWLPLEGQSEPVAPKARQSLLRKIAMDAARLLSPDGPRRADWGEIYRQRVLELGYPPDRDFESVMETLRWCCVRFFGDLYLRAHDLGLALPGDKVWVPSLLAPHVEPTITSLKHVLFQIFLDGTDGPVRPVLNRRGLAQSARAEDDAKIARRLIEQIQHIKTEGQKCNFKTLLVNAGGWEAYRVHRRGYPKMRAVLDEFLKTENSFGLPRKEA